MKAKSRSILILLMVMFALPVVLPFLMLKGDFSTKNNGDLIEPVLPIEQAKLRIWPDNTQVDADFFNGLWELMVISEGSCSDACLRDIYEMNQVRLTQIKNIDNLRVVWLTDDGVSDTLRQSISEQFPDVMILNFQSNDNQWISQLKQQLNKDRLNGIYINDYLGFMMMSYPSDLSPSLIQKDVKHLFKAVSTQKKKPEAVINHEQQQKND